MPPKKTAATTKSETKPKTSKKRVEKPDAEAKSKEEPEKKMKKIPEKAQEKTLRTRTAATKKENIKDEQEESGESENEMVKKKVTRSKKTKGEDIPTENEINPKKVTKAEKLKKDKPTEKASNTETEKNVTVRAKRGKKTDKEESQQPEEEDVKKGPKRKATKAEKGKSKDEPETKSTKVNATNTDWETVDFKCASRTSNGDASNFHITSWNVDGLRAWVKKGGLNILQYDEPDIFCVQETKCSEEKLPDEVKSIEGYETFWCSSEKEGYAGVGIATKVKPISVKYGIDSEEHDSEGRCITVEYEKFFLVNVYVPNAGRKLVTLPKRLDWNTLFKEHIKELDKLKPVIVCGDMNVAHLEIDLANPKTNTKSAGFTKEEREGMTEFLQDGYIDTFRDLYPDKEKAYTFWTYMTNARSKNVGWRLDYFIVSERLMENVCDNIIHSGVLGSDHCPLTLHVNI